MHRNILIVDDSPSMRQLVRFTLEPAGYAVVERADGPSALDYAYGEPADFVLADLNMPSMDGLQLVGELRLLPAYRYTPIFVLTADTGTALRRRGRDAGATGWIVKPFDPQELIETVQRVI